MARITLLLMCLFFSAALYAQQKSSLVTGKVVTLDGKPAPAVMVMVEETRQLAFTDEQGAFSFALHPGVYTLKAQSSANSNSTMANLDIQGDTSIQLALKVRSVQLDEIIVTGQFEPQSARNSVYQVRTISHERIRLRAANSIPEILNNELGVRFSKDLTLGTSDISLMGMTGQGVKILLNGVPVPDRGATRESLGQIDINNVDRIEIVEGPMSVIYGTDALAGVINIITKKGTGENKLEISAKLQEESVGKEYQGFSNQGAHNQHFSVNLNKNAWLVGASASQNNFGGWQGNSLGRSHDWHPKDQLLLNPQIGYSLEKLKLWYSGNYTSETIYSYGLPNANTNMATDKDYISKRFFQQLQGDYKVNNNLNFTAALAYTDYSRRTQTTILNVLNGDRRLSLESGTQDTSSMTSKFLRVTSQYKISPKISLQPGVEINLNGASGARIVGSPQIDDYAFFLSSEIKPLKGINIRPAFRIIRNSVYDAPPIIPAINTLFNLSKNLDMRMAYARGFRSPALRELYFNFFDASHSITGNTNLKAEYSNSANASFTWHDQLASSLNYDVTLSGFYNAFSNLIDVGLDPKQTGVYTYINVDKFKTTGGSIQHTLRWDQLQVLTGFSYIGRYNKFHYEESSAALANFAWSPEVNSTIMYNFAKIGTSFNLNYKWNGKKPAYELSEVNGKNLVSITETAAFHLADFTVNKKINRFVSLAGGVKNLFNVTQVLNSSSNVGSAHSTAGPIPVSYGRSFFLGLSMQWSKNLTSNN